MSEIIKDINPVNTFIFPIKNYRLGNTFRFSFDATCASGKECGVAVFDRVSEKLLAKIPFKNEHKIGNAYSFEINDYDNSKYCYSFYDEKGFITDERAERYVNHHSVFGNDAFSKVIKSAFSEPFNWDGDIKPATKYEDSFIYLLHVRGFTRHASSGTDFKGTFRGIVDKISYLKGLGVTAIELQPAYEFNECNLKSDKKNYWGYCKGYYYAPKAAYSYSEDASSEFCEMVKSLHKENIEVIMQMYFPDDMQKREIPAILEYWANKYHVDGFHVLGANLDNRLIDESIILADTKIMLDNLDGIRFDSSSVYEGSFIKRYALYRDDYMYALRKFLKGDDNSISDALFRMRFNPATYATVNFFDSYNTFTLYDLVSYDRKHNEENDEDNRDGSDYNLSWNCGAEGPSRKQKVVKLRKKQIENALLMLFLSAGTPMIFMGDEMGNTQRGNNNPYCHDSSITWLDWKCLERNTNEYDYIANLAKMRRDNPFLHSNKELSMIDIEGHGFPELSYHGESPWKTQVEGYRHNVGILYCENDVLTYVALNMHWASETLSLPRPPKGMKWGFVSSTEDEIIEITDSKVKVPERSIAIFRTVSK